MFPVPAPFKAVTTRQTATAAAYETPTSVHVTKMHKHYYGQLEVIIMVRYAIGIRQYSGCHVSIK